MKSKIMILFALLSICISLINCSQPDSEIEIVVGPNPSSKKNLSAEILQDYLSKMLPNSRINVVETGHQNTQILLVTFSELSENDRTGLVSDFSDLSLPKEPESFSMSHKDEAGKNIAIICGYDERGLQYGIYDALEKLGWRFYLSEDFVPEITGDFQIDKLEGTDKALVSERIVFNWHNFLSGISSWNMKEYKQWIDASVKMKYNALMFHAYGSDPFMQYTFNGIRKPTGLVPSTQKGRDWGINHVNDIRNLYGGDAFKEPVFGSKVSKMPESQMDAEAVKLLQNAMKYANDRSLDINFGFDISTIQSNPEEQLSTLPKSAQLRNFGGRLLANPETPEGYTFFKSQIAGLLEDYPYLTHITPWVRYMRYPSGGVYNAVKNMLRR